MGITLPGWVIDNHASVLREAAPYREMEFAERTLHLARACRAAARLLRARDDAEGALTHVDPLPESSVAALARLRRQRRRRSPGR